MRAAALVLLACAATIIADGDAEHVCDQIEDLGGCAGGFIRVVEGSPPRETTGDLYFCCEPTPPCDTLTPRDAWHEVVPLSTYRDRVCAFRIGIDGGCTPAGNGWNCTTAENGGEISSHDDPESTVSSSCSAPFS